MRIPIPNCIALRPAVFVDDADGWTHRTSPLFVRFQKCAQRTRKIKCIHKWESRDKKTPLCLKGEGHVTIKLCEVSLRDIVHKINVECRTAFVPKRRIS